MQGCRDALLKIETMILNRVNPDTAMDMISEHIFCEKGSSPGLTPTLELQRVVVLGEYFEKPGSEANRNSIFLSLFSGSLPKSRIRLLGKLISTSISALIAPLLCTAGTWMQQLGCTAQPSLELTEYLIEDFVTYSSKVCDQLESLPMIAPRFAANFMTAVCDLYLTDARGPKIEPPPKILLNVFSEWVFENPSLCLVSSQQPVSLPVGAIAMPVTTPLAGLIRWCVLAPLFDSKQNYDKLHLAILRSFQQTPPASGPASIVNAQHLVAIVNTIQLKMVDFKDGGQEDPIQLSLERFAQSIQVAVTCNCIYGNTHLLFARLESLPANALMDIVIKTNRIK